MILTHTFYKENGIWYIDLPSFIEEGLGTKSNLMMVGGADTLLDKLSNNGDKITLQFSDSAFVGWTTYLRMIKHGVDKDYLEKVGHAPVDNGAYYEALVIDEKKTNHKLWLCPVTEYVFLSDYPEDIYIKII
jgi:hypothetical protein